MVGPNTGGTSEGFRFKKLAEKSEETEAKEDDVNSFANPNYENPEVGTKSEPVAAPVPTLFGKLVSVEEEKETEDAKESGEKVYRDDSQKEKVGEVTRSCFIDGEKFSKDLLSGSQNDRIGWAPRYSAKSR